MDSDLHPDQVWDGWIFLKHVAERMILDRAITIAEALETLSKPEKFVPGDTEGSMLYATRKVFVVANWTTREVITAYRPRPDQLRKVGL